MKTRFEECPIPKSEINTPFSHSILAKSISRAIISLGLFFKIIYFYTVFMKKMSFGWINCAMLWRLYREFYICFTGSHIMSQLHSSLAWLLIHVSLININVSGVV